MKKLFSILILLFLIGIVSANQTCQIYDDFSSGSLDTSKWEIRQDVEGWSFTEEYGIDTNLSNFHTQQNSLGEIHGTFLFPKRQFTTGDILEYEHNVVSKEGSYMTMDLLTGDNYIRVGINGFWSGSVQGYDELGTSHIKIEFQENNFHLERTTPSNVTLIDNLPLTNTNGSYELYIGAGTGQDGRMHIDFDNFVLCTEEPEPSLEERVVILEQRVNELENRTSWLESMINKIVEFIKSLPEGLSRGWID